MLHSPRLIEMPPVTYAPIQSARNTVYFLTLRTSSGKPGKTYTISEAANRLGETPTLGDDGHREGAHVHSARGLLRCRRQRQRRRRRWRDTGLCDRHLATLFLTFSPPSLFYVSPFTRFTPSLAPLSISWSPPLRLFLSLAQSLAGPGLLLFFSPHLRDTSISRFSAGGGCGE